MSGHGRTLKPVPGAVVREVGGVRGGTLVALLHAIMDEDLAGKRCRTVRPIMHHAGLIPRASTGRIRSEMENIGRRLVRIDLDSGRSLVLLAEDIACEDAAQLGNV